VITAFLRCGLGLGGQDFFKLHFISRSIEAQNSLQHKFRFSSICTRMGQASWKLCYSLHLYTGQPVCMCGSTKYEATEQSMTHTSDGHAVTEHEHQVTLCIVFIYGCLLLQFKHTI